MNFTAFLFLRRSILLAAGRLLKRCLPVLPCLLTCPVPAWTQSQKVDSMAALLHLTKSDTARVQLLWRMGNEASYYAPDSALSFSYQAYSIARKNGYRDGESKALGAMANTFLRIGNYPRALELYIERLKLEEKRNIPLNLAGVTMDIGIVHALQEEYPAALAYYKTADSIIRTQHIESLKYNIALNTGDTYDRLDLPDSAFRYFSASLVLARAAGDDNFIGYSLTGLGHSYRKKGDLPRAGTYYQTAIAYLTAAGNNESLCEASLGLARVFQAAGSFDSARYYAHYALAAARPAFLARELEASQFLIGLYRAAGRYDSSFLYVDKVQALNNLINSKDNIRRMQIIASNENLRQLELAEERKAAKKERSVQLQLLLIAVFIPAFFLITLAISRAALSVRFIRLMGVLSLLFFFEFITLLLHPRIASLTHHTPVFELIILVAIAAIIIPLHHRMEHWMIEKLIHRREHYLARLQAKVKPGILPKAKPPAVQAAKKEKQ